MPALLEVDRLKIDARKDDGSLLPIVKGVSFSVERGEVLGTGRLRLLTECYPECYREWRRG